MKIHFLPLVLAGVFVVFNAAHSSTEAARVNDKVITIEEVKAKVAEAARNNPMNAPTKKQVLDDLIRREAAIQEARKVKLDQDPVVIERLNNVLYAALVEKRLGADFARLNVSDGEAKNWYAKNPEIRTSHIFIALPQDAKDEDEARASKHLEDILKEIKSGKSSFAEAAQKYSEDPSAALGGDLDYRMKDRLDPAFLRAALKLGKIGDIAGPVRTPFGVHLIRLTGKRNWLEVDRTRVKALMVEDRRQEMVSKFLNDLREKARVSTNEKALRE